MSDSPKNPSYTPSYQWRMVILLFAVAILIYALFNYRDWINRDRYFDTKGWLAFISDANGHDDLWVADATGKLTPITNDEAEDEQPTWLPSGNRIVFVSNRTTEKLTKPVLQLYSIRPDGGSLQGLTVGGGAKQNPTVSADGNRVLHISQGFVTEVDLKDHHAEQLLPATDNQQAMVAWQEKLASPVRKAAWCPANESYILAQLPPDKDNALVVELGVSLNSLPPLLIAAKRLDWAWCPSVPEILVTYRGGVPLSAVLEDAPKLAPPFKNGVLLLRIMSKIEADDSKLPELVRIPPDQPTISVVIESAHDLGSRIAMLEPAYSPDGDKVAFVVAEAKGDDLSRKAIAVLSTSDLRSAGGLPVPTAIVRGNVGTPRWSPDGKKLAYIQYYDSKRDIWTVNTDGTDAKNLTNGKGDNREPVWSPQK